ncbi:hydrolase [Diplogelasinospora grovesii]|uniref:Hydrolase n=1 Tax=Diplogelasinospora grovesii TaxID=303347 RepID=A0AAN6S5Q9_9PEZI|nr:hydrolase [Diplogelasinospora grovesii]
MAPVYKIALIQLQPKDVAVQDNFSRAASFIRAAAAAGAHLAVLPEYHLTSWCPEHPEFVSSSFESWVYLNKYRQLARELNINIVPGTLCEVHPLPEDASSRATTTTTTGGDVIIPRHGEMQVELRNMAYFISAGSGEIAGSYQKKNLWHPERPHLTAGVHEPHTSFDIPLTTEGEDGKERQLRAGLLVCWDLAFPEAFRALIADGADMVIVPSFWHLTDVDPTARGLNPMCEKLFLESVAVARAFENTCAVVFCNSGGCSQVAMPILGSIGEDGKAGGKTMDMNQEEMKILEVDFGVLRLAEQNYKVREDMQGKGWHYGYTLTRDT